MKNRDESDILKKVELLILDVDGVLTDGQLIISSTGEEAKSFCVEDGTGAVIAKFAKLPIAWLSGRYSKCTEIRADELGIRCCIQGALDKKNKLSEIMDKFKVKSDQVAYVGDGLVDIPVLEIVGVPISVPNGHELVKERCCIITENSGGKGVLSELVEKILKAKSIYENTLKMMKDTKFK